MNLEELIQETNIQTFFNEFSFDKNKFKNPTQKELELADNVVIMDKLILVFQLKERDATGKSSRINEWYRANIRNKAVTQIKNTHEYFREYLPINIKNTQGYEVEINDINENRFFNIICYKSEKVNIHKKFYDNADVGIIHVFTYDEYRRISELLITPNELIEYLEFREKIIVEYKDKISEYNEKDILGHYLSGELDKEPNGSYLEYYYKIISNPIEIREIIRDIGRKLYPPNDNNKDYYQILIEINKLNRSTLDEIEKRFNRCIEIVSSGKFTDKIMRLYSDKSKCAYCFVTATKTEFKNRQELLLKKAQVARYSLKANKIIGISFVLKDKYFYIDWAYIEGDYQYSEEMEKFIKETGCFNKIRSVNKERYQFK